MRRTSCFVILMLFSLLACGEESEGIPELSVSQVSTMMQQGELVAVDANGPGTRLERGVIPGARLLTSSGSYDPSTELPEDHTTPLVFYCANTSCRASDGAARRAQEAGYSEVHVMRAGIAGWIEAGNPTAPPPT